MYNQNSDLMKQEKFMLPTMIEGDFSAEELAEDADGLQMSFQRVKIPAGGTLQFEMPSDDPDNPDYEKTLVGVILHNHATCAYWPAGSEYDDDTTPLCSSVDGKVGIGTPGGACAACVMNRFGSAPDGSKGKAKIYDFKRKGKQMITSKQRSFLKALAHGEDAAVYIGKAGLTNNHVISSSRRFILIKRYHIRTGFSISAEALLQYH